MYLESTADLFEHFCDTTKVMLVSITLSTLSAVDNIRICMRKYLGGKAGFVTHTLSGCQAGHCAFILMTVSTSSPYKRKKNLNPVVQIINTLQKKKIEDHPSSLLKVLFKNESFS